MQTIVNIYVITFYLGERLSCIFSLTLRMNSKSSSLAVHLRRIDSLRGRMRESVAWLAVLSTVVAVDNGFSTSRSVSISRWSIFSFFKSFTCCDCIEIILNHEEIIAASNSV